MRIAILGFMLESNSFAPPADEAEFRSKLWLEGEGLLADVRADPSRDPGGLKGFVEVMDAHGPWTPVPLAITSAGASGPIEDGFFRRFVALIEDGLRAALPLDAVYIEAHGAAAGTAEDDPEGALFTAIRAIVGADIPVVATLDLHANVSQTMVDQTDLLIAYITNPHVDMRERGQEAGRAMLELLAGVKTAKSFIKLPILPPQVALLSDRGPYGAAIDRAVAMQADPKIINVSVQGNFAFGNYPKNGMSVIATTRGDQAAADAAAREIAAELWRRRGELVARLTTIDTAAEMLKAACADSSKPALLFADCADNPGGGARGNTTAILRAFLDAGVDRTAFAIHFDPALAAEAHALGVSATFTAHLNRDETHPDSAKLSASAQVMALSDGRIVGRRGQLANRTFDCGATAWLRLEGRIDVVFVSIRHQCMEPRMLEHLGIDLRTLRGLVVKSRGHFRAGFDDIYSDSQIFEVDGPGLATPMLKRVPFTRVPRPIWPLDEDMVWSI